MAAGLFFMNFSEFGWAGRHIFPTPLSFAFVPLGLSLSISTIFRVATIVRSDGRFFRQRFRFLGYCMTSRLPYTPMAIFLNRSVGRPLVRGESFAIIAARAFVLSCIGLAIPAFGIYAMVISPIRAQVYTRSVATFAGADLGSPPGNATFLITSFNFDESQPSADFSVNSFVAADLVRSSNCSVTALDTELVVECPLPWTSVRSVSTSINIRPGYVVTITPLPEKPVILSWEEVQSDFNSVRTHIATNPTPLVSGSHLFGRLTWKKREMLSRWVLGLPTAMKSVFTAEISGLQTLPSITSATNEASLQLYQPYSYAIRLEQDSSDVSPLSGLSTFGGFWSFVNGAFALFFGANVVYFAVGRRPLSALGLIHIFQRNTLVRRWHADFPALRTEGGVAGSETAGVVAFIRERLIDIDEELPAAPQNDLESQSSVLNHTRDDSRTSLLDLTKE
ncbi:hypothetical protein C8F04DRAFT_1115455 [Mycena alexandri]|uniref:Uncharacterized protein n=1 Tax=Mycena alexandri TaxID=1745969 RepID=A0AAD6X057_9AGAR|nr:hypothetical protein C8F04DRAFT_1115455 [Mycena alexandri]